jgi:3-deoxy-D-manno-octulosonate 8-phosphate phosphatase (KDO 8-P phosphatase)
VTGRKAVRGLVFDVDGVMTDGTVEISSSGHESKRFSIQDGTALLWCRMLGYELALVSGRESVATEIRAAELGIDGVYQGVRDKAAQVTKWAGSKGLALGEVLYMGDDHIDLPVFDAVGVSVAPANADPHVRARAMHVTAARGGDGAVREAIEWLLAGAGRLEEALAAYRERVSGEPTERGV